MIGEFEVDTGGGVPRNSSRNRKLLVIMGRTASLGALASQMSMARVANY